MIKNLEPHIPRGDLQGPRWIVTPDGDLGREFCDTCGYYLVRHLRRRDRKRRDDYILDGGWRTEKESFCFCAVCGKRLSVAILKYGIIDALEDFKELGFSKDPGEDAYEIGEILSALEYRSDRDDANTEHLRADALKIAEQFLAQLSLNIIEGS